MNINLPTRQNGKLRALVDAINADVELAQLYICTNINAVDRSGLNDHGEVHIRIVANAALRLVRLLVEAGVTPSVVLNHGMEAFDAELIVVLAACLHDVGMVVHRNEHELLSLIIAYPKARQLLAPIYSEPQLTTMVSETLHAIVAHNWEQECLTIEAGVVKVADALDMTQGRSRIPFEAGAVNIHSVSAQSIQEVRIERGDERPVRIVVALSGTAGIFQVDELLQRKLRHSTLSPHVEIVARLESTTEHLSKVYKF